MSADFEAAKALFLEGLAAFEAGRFEHAQTCFVASLAKLPGRVSTLINLAATRNALHRPQEALEIADQVLAREPDNVDAWLHRGNALAQLGDLGAALVAFEAVCRLDPRQAQAWSHRGSILRETGRLDEAAQAIERALALGADAPLHRYYLAAVRQRAAPPPTAPAGYVQSLFDDYARSFDTHLVQDLGYQAHRTLVENLDFPPSGRFASGLDLGCGTGLCGALLAPRVGMLTGVDLSAGMLAQARALGIYRHLVQAELLDHLRATDERHDLVLAADVFIYVGDLAPVFEAVRRVLRPGGVFCFSVENASREDLDFELLPSLRYAHSQSYLNRLAERCGFTRLRSVEQPIREEQRLPIAGRYLYLGLH